jgi:hypothetical protein
LNRGMKILFCGMVLRRDLWAWKKSYELWEEIFMSTIYLENTSQKKGSLRKVKWGKLLCEFVHLPTTKKKKRKRIFKNSWRVTLLSRCILNFNVVSTCGIFDCTDNLMLARKCHLTFQNDWNFLFARDNVIQLVSVKFLWSRSSFHFNILAEQFLKVLFTSIKCAFKLAIWSVSINYKLEKSMRSFFINLHFPH